MATIVSNRNAKLIINGVEFTGFADEDPIIDWPEEDFIEIVTGKDGLTYGNDLAMIGGEIVVKLLPVSPTIPQVMAWRNAWVEGERQNFEGTYSDSEIQCSVNFTEGYLVRCPPMIMPGTNFEVGFYFEKYLSDFDTARFQATPQAPKAGAGRLGALNDHEGMGPGTVQTGIGGIQGNSLEALTAAFT